MSGWWAVPTMVVALAADEVVRIPAAVPTTGPNQVVVYVPLMT